MTIHANSHLAYAMVQQTGMLARQELAALHEVLVGGPGTNREIDKRIGHGGRSWHPTLHRLEKRGMLEVLKSRPCGVSGAQASVYSWTGRATPLAYTKPTTKLAKARAALVRVEAERDALRVVLEELCGGHYTVGTWDRARSALDASKGGG